jgi:hypothetical protein
MRRPVRVASKVASGVGAAAEEVAEVNNATKIGLGKRFVLEQGIKTTSML